MSDLQRAAGPGASVREELSRPASPSRRDFSFAALPSEISGYLEQIDRGLARVPRRDAVLVGIAEALANAIVHGALGVSSRARNEGDIEAFFAQIERAEAQRGASQRVAVHLQTRGRSVEISVSDDGEGFDWSAPSADGNGLSILQRVFDEVRWNPRGNTVHLTIHGDEE